MLFTQTDLEGAYIVEPEKLKDDRGYFARTWCQKEFQDQSLDPNLVQCSISFNKKKGTLRGMHLQLPPSSETKLVRCTRGAIYDVIIDLRLDSTTYLKWIAITLTAENSKALYIPKGFAHGFQTLEDNTEIFYQMSDFYSPNCAVGFRWNDPRFKIQWLEEISVISERDQQYKDYTPEMITQ